MIEGARWRTWVFFYVPMAMFLVFLLFPFYWMVITSVRPDGELYRPWNSINYNPFWTWKPTWDHVRFLFEETLFASWLWNTMFIALASTAISLVCGVFAGYALSRLNFPFAGSLGTGIFITYLVPQTLLFIPLAEIIRNYRLGDTPWSLILTYPTFLIPFCTWLMMGYFKAVPKELEECARIDGASRWQAMLYIVIPVAIPGILSAGIFAFTLSWNEFIYALVFLSSPGQKTVPVGVTSELIRGDVFFWGPLMAGALLGSIPVANRIFVFRRALRRRVNRIGEGLIARIIGIAHAQLRQAVGRQVGAMGQVVLKGLNKFYDSVHAVKDVNLQIRDKEFVVFVGPSGCGKTTTLRMIAGLEAISSGDISIDGNVINELAPMDRDIAMVFQNYAPLPAHERLPQHGVRSEDAQIRKGRN
jgi:multiple sugar transport system permease protein